MWFWLARPTKKTTDRKLKKRATNINVAVFFRLEEEEEDLSNNFLKWIFSAC